MRQKKSVVTSERDLKKAKSQLAFNIKIGGKVFSFNSNIFDLNKDIIGILNEQITEIPGNIAYVMEAYGEAKLKLASLETEYSIWQAGLFQKYSDERSETAKRNRMIAEFNKEYTAYETSVREANKLVCTLKAYRQGVDAKLQLAQTLSANIRTERESFYRDMDKKQKVGKLVKG